MGFRINVIYYDPPKPTAFNRAIATFKKNEVRYLKVIFSTNTFGILFLIVLSCAIAYSAIYGERRKDSELALRVKELEAKLATPMNNLPYKVEYFRDKNTDICFAYFPELHAITEVGCGE